MPRRVTRPSFSFEQTLYAKGFSLVVGVDEVGRGALAGPVVAGACSVRGPLASLQGDPLSLNEITALGIDDSKRLTSKKREALAPEIEKYFQCAIGEASVAEINKYGIVAATQKAMRRAIKSLGSLVVRRSRNDKKTIQANDQRLTTNDPLSFLLIDGKFPLPHCQGLPLSRQKAIIKGDQQSISIAAASIIAKVYRDRLMCQLAKQYPRYGWEKNKGYGTQQHLQAIRLRGITGMHRRAFVSEI